MKIIPGAWIVAVLSVEARPSPEAGAAPRRGMAAVTFLQPIGAP
ncbi:hypothetical protein [Phenylobacterium sp.]|nr:hypothetical protein [Phenylobacterium sp.]